MNKDTSKISGELGSDLPLTDPAEDAFGYAPFASQLAAAIVENKSPQGLVLAVHGKWGSGKSSLLNFIKHDLRKLPLEGQPIIVDFNPWWFEGREQIATQLLGQFSAQLPDRLKRFRVIAKLVGEYSKQIANAAADVSGYGWIKGPLSWLLGRIPGLKFLTEKTGIPSVKKKVASALKKSGKRFVFFIDDIDRLTPDEARDFFRAIKALADFPEVIYVLFFDREEVVKSLTASLKMDGEAYLEKIVQAPFHLPAIEKGALDQKLFKGLDALLDADPISFEFDKSRWAATYYGGLDRCIKKPRDIVRALNALSVTYPPLAGEVNPVDFIALEFLRVFQPETYQSIRDGKDFFCGEASEISHKKGPERQYFDAWKEGLPPRERVWLTALVGRLFPKVAKILGGDFIGSGDARTWRRELRPCSEDCFSVYFQFGLPAGHVSKAELDRLTSQQTPDQVFELLLDAKEVVFPDGHSKARDLLERIQDLDRLTPEQATVLIEALVANGEQILRPADERGGFMSVPNRWRIEFVLTHLLGSLDLDGRQALLRKLTITSPGLWILVGLVDLASDAKRDPSKAPDSLSELDPLFVKEIKANLGKRLDEAPLTDLLLIPELDYIVHCWHAWGDGSTIAQKFQPMLDDDELFLSLVDKFVRTGLRQSGSGMTETYRVAMTPLSYAMDVISMEPRVQALLGCSGLNKRQHSALTYFLKSLSVIRDGGRPDEDFLVDGDD